MRYVCGMSGGRGGISYVWGMYWVSMGHVSSMHGVCMEYVWGICVGDVHGAYVWGICIWVTYGICMGVSYDYANLSSLCDSRRGHSRHGSFSFRFAIPAEAIQDTGVLNDIIFVPGVRFCFDHGNGKICLIPAAHMSRGHIFEKCRNLVPAGHMSRGTYWRNEKI